MVARFTAFVLYYIDRLLSWTFIEGRIERKKALTACVNIYSIKIEQIIAIKLIIL